MNCRVPQDHLWRLSREQKRRCFILPVWPTISSCWSRFASKRLSQTATTTNGRSLHFVTSVLLHVRSKFLTTGKDNLLETYHRPAVLGAIARRGDFVARLHRISLPAGPGEHAYGTQLDAPLFDGALPIFHVEINVSMGIGPVEPGYGPLHGGRLGHIERRCRVMCVGRSCKRKQQKNSGNGNKQQIIPHRVSPFLLSSYC